MTPVARIAALAAVGVWVLLAILLGVGWQLDQARERQWQTQVDHYLLQHLRTTAEEYLATGLQLDQMEVLQNVIEREKSAFVQIVAVDVFHAGGTVLYSTDTDSRGQPAPEDWRRRLTQTPIWQHQSPGLRQVGLRFDNDLGQAAGGIVLTLSTAAAPATLVQWKERAQVAVQWLALAVLAALAAAVGCWLVLGRMLRPYEEASRILRGGEPRARGPLAQAAQRQHERWAEQHRRCRQARQDLEALDAGH